MRLGAGCAPELAKRMWHINDLYGVNAAHPAELLSVIALDNLDRVGCSRQTIAGNKPPSLDAFLASRGDLEYYPPEVRHYYFSETLAAAVLTSFYRLLTEKYETCVAPGSYFDMPQHFRAGHWRRSRDDARGVGAARAGIG